ncbi:uncharacterized protein LOC114298816 [Camellia sinensis]|uniref:uncharacterized protein LOC114298816 n=1 Tax=Camellia sinensis TaxID=4442 RepID=UPI001035FE1F|nr:uncharacterized protein LOC114298816 [Camellia sinensis]
MSDRDSKFTLRFWQSLQQALGTALRLSSAYHPQMDDQSERTIQTLEDMRRMYVLDFQENWETYLPLAKFVYNNSYHLSIGMAPYKALYQENANLRFDYLRDLHHVIEPTRVLLKDYYMYEERPIQIVNRQIKIEKQGNFISESRLAKSWRDVIRGGPNSVNGEDYNNPDL